jgi:phosphoribosylformylglycinamidine synthase
MKNKKINAGITVFPGSNCDMDVYYALNDVFNLNVSFLWHKDEFHNFKNYDFIVIPGGFSYGDYLRAGALAARSRIMESIKEYADGGGIVLGICNGFQILLESGLLKGAMLTNKSLKFECKDIYIKNISGNNRNNSHENPFTCLMEKDAILKLPIAHHDGNYFVEKKKLNYLFSSGYIAFQYCNEEGVISDDSNPNGSMENIGGLFGENFNVMGLMPHPERASEKILGSGDGAKIFNSIIYYIKNK